jgi:glucuronoarabinoxylan endo-1,4-beta-xylanase
MNGMRRCAQTSLGCLLISLASAKSASAQTATVDVTSQKQMIRGFGGMSQAVWIGDLTAAQRTTAFGNGDGQLGFTVLRIWVSDLQTDWSKDVATAKAATSLGAIVFATPWNPPASMTVTVGGKKEIDPTQYAAYATHLNDYVAYMKGQNVNIYAIGVQNEPDYASAWTAWTPTQVHDFILNYGAQITTKLITAESFNYTKSYYDPILSDPNALKNVAVVGTHLYGTPVANFPYPLFDQDGAGKERWMTEHYTDSTTDADSWPNALGVATEIHHAMVDAQFNVYTWWYIRRSYGPIKEDGSISKRGYCMAQFSKFIRPGFNRVNATTSGAAGVYVSAYKSATDVVLVAVNTNASAQPLTVSINDPGIASYARFTTSGTKSLASDGTVHLSNGTLSLSLDAESVTTLHGATTGAMADGGVPDSGLPDSGLPDSGPPMLEDAGGMDAADLADGADESSESGAPSGSSGTTGSSGGSVSSSGTTGGGSSGASGSQGGSSSATIGATGAPPSVGGAPSSSGQEAGCGCVAAGDRSSSEAGSLLAMLGVLTLGAVRRRPKSGAR